jgi:hypothetical protein
VARAKKAAGPESPADAAAPATPASVAGPVVHDDSALWHAVYAAAWVAEFNETSSPSDPESLSEALEIDHSYAARQIANAAVAQLRRSR